MPMPLFKRYKELTVKNIIKIDIIVRENDIETSLIPSIPSLKVFTTYSIGFAKDIDLQNSGKILIE